MRLSAPQSVLAYSCLLLFLARCNLVIGDSHLQSRIVPGIVSDGDYILDDKYEEVLIPSEDDTAATHYGKPGYFDHIVAPVKSYANLINRFRVWYTTKGSKQPHLAATLKLKYARVDDELSKEMCSADANLSEESLSNKDFVFEVLRRLVDQLEKDDSNLSNLEKDLTDAGQEQGSLGQTGESQDVQSTYEDQERIRIAMARLRQIGSSMMKSAVRNEASALAEMAAWHAASIALASFTMLPPNLGAVLSFCVGYAETPYLVKYLRGIGWRVLASAAGPFNPMSYMKCANHSQLKNH